MKTVTMFYMLNATLLLLHEIESAYEREWEILKLPGKLAGFLIFHIPIIFIMLYGLLAIDKQTQSGSVLGVLTGIGGIIPFLVHKIFMNRKERFNSILSNVVIYLNSLTGIGTILFSAHFII